MITSRQKSWAEILPVLAAVLCILVPELPLAQAAERKPLISSGSLARKYVDQAKQAMDKKQFSRAIRLLSRGIARDKKSAVAYKLRGVSYSRMGHHHKAVRDFSRLIELRPSDPNGYLLRANARNFNLDHKGAVEDYTLALKFKPTSVEAYIGRGLAYAGLEQYIHALKDYQWALQLEPGNLEALSNAGRACMLSGRPLAAMTYLKMALERERDPQWIRRIKTWMSKLVEETDKAEKPKPTTTPTRAQRSRPQLKPLW